MENERPLDTLGLISIGVGVVTFGSCIGACVPYLGCFVMPISMGMSLLGTLLGVFAIKRTVDAAESPVMGAVGTVMNGIPLLLWLLYWVMICAGMAMVVVASLLDQSM